MMKEGFSRRLKAVITDSGKTYDKIADTCGISRSNITRYVNANSMAMPGAYNLALLCEGLNVSADYLLFGRGDVPTSHENFFEIDGTWNDNMAESAIEDFNNIQSDLPYVVCSNIGTALEKLKLLEEQGARVVDES